MTEQPSEAYLQQVIAAQPRLYAYVLTLLANATEADDVLQEVNLVLLRKASEFVAGSNFDAWAFRIARLQCMAYWKLQSRDRLVFDEQAIESLAEKVESRLVEVDARTHAMRNCLQKLSRKQLALLERRYEIGGSVKQMSAQLGRSEASISQTLYRIRNLLLECIRGQLATQEEGS
jgi:RNA polymerase sigma-70 factor (ECF subfamily)